LNKFIAMAMCLTLMALMFGGDNAKKIENSYKWPILEGFPKPQVPLDNPMSDEKVALGKQLFFDKNLSANQQQSCESCHMQQFAFAEPLSVSVGSTGACIDEMLQP